MTARYNYHSKVVQGVSSVETSNTWLKLTPCVTANVWSMSASSVSTPTMHTDAMPCNPFYTVMACLSLPSAAL